MEDDAIDDRPVEIMSPEHEAAVAEGLEQAKQRRFVSSERLAAVFRRLRP